MHLVPAGINIIDGRRIDEEKLDQEVCLLDRKEVAVNINTLEELKIAEKLFQREFKARSFESLPPSL
jgi:GTP:adenosylcobinamide-phosphate guanylyltransferase